MQRRVIDQAWMAEQDRLAIEWMRNRDPSEPCVSSDRVHEFLIELNRR